MADPDELNKFVRKFVSLWQSGRHASLYVETEAGNAFVNLMVGLGQALPLPGEHVPAGGRPAKERRKVRRAAVREGTVAAEKAVVAANSGQDKAEEALLEKKDIAEAETVFEKVMNSPIPQIDGTADRNVCYELTVEAHMECTHDDVIEAIEANFFGSLDDENVKENDPLRYIIVQQADENQKLYEVAVKDNETSMKVIEKWNDPYEFDDLAFKNSVYDKIKIKIREVRRLE